MENRVVRLTGRYTPRRQEVIEQLKEKLAIWDAQLLYERSIGDTVDLLVFQKYYFRTKSYCCLIIVLASESHEMSAELVASGQDLDGYFRAAGAGAEFLRDAVDVLQTLGFSGEQEDWLAENERNGLLSAVKTWWRKE